MDITAKKTIDRTTKKVLDFFCENKVEDTIKDESLRNTAFKDTLGYNTSNDFNKIYVNVKTAKEQIENLQNEIEEKQVREVLFRIKEINEIRNELVREKKLEIYRYLVSKVLANKWEGDLKEQYELTDKILSNDIFISYSSNDFPEHDYSPNVINKQYKGLIEEVIGEKDTLKEDWNTQNLLPRVIIRHVKNNFEGMNIFFDYEKIHSKDELKKIEKACKSSFSLVQLITPSIFREIEEKETNWCLQEYNFFTKAIEMYERYNSHGYRDILKEQFHFLLTHNTYKRKNKIPDSSESNDADPYKQWKAHIRSKHCPWLDPNDIDGCLEIIRKLVNNILNEKEKLIYSVGKVEYDLD